MSSRLRQDAQSVAIAALASVTLGLLIAQAASPIGEVVRASNVTGYALALATITLAALVVARATRHIGVLSGIGVTCFFFAWTFGLRPLYLFATGAESAPYQSALNPFVSLSNVESQEIVLFFSSRALSLSRSAVTTIAFGLIFFLAFLVSYLIRGRLGQSSASERRASDVVAEPRRPFLTSSTVVLAIVALISQAAVLGATGGLRRTANSLVTQDALSLPFYYYVGVSAGPIALCMFYASRQKLSGAARTLFFLAVAEVTLFAGLTGSRSRAVLPLALLFVIAHLTRRRFSTRRLVVIFTLIVVSASIFLVIRQETQKSSFSAAVSSAFTNPPTVGVLMNDNSTFDAATEAVALGPDYLNNQAGDRFVSGLAAAVPSVVYGESKPQTSDVWFREQVWGNRFLGGRPFSLVGELWLDFGVLGLVLGGLALGWAVSRLDQSLAQASSTTSAERIVFTAFLVVMLWTLLGGGTSLFVGQLLLYGIPLIAAGLLLRLASPRHG